MEISQNINELINKQISIEGKNANIYKQISSWFESQNLSGFGKYFSEQADGEIEHKNKFISYLNDRTGGKVKMLQVPEININITSLIDVGNLYIETEEATTKEIYNIAQQSLSELDFMTFEAIQWFVKEQVEEEYSASEFLSKANLINENGVGIVLWNEELE